MEKLDDQVDRLRALVHQAELATSNVSDPELRKSAFETVLAKLLVGTAQEPPSVSPPPAGETTHSHPKKARKIRTVTGPSKWVEEILGEGYFSQQRSLTDVTNRVCELGHHVKSKDVTYPLLRLVAQKKLRRSRQELAGGKRGDWIYARY